MKKEGGGGKAFNKYIQIRNKFYFKRDIFLLKWLTINATLPKSNSLKPAYTKKSFPKIANHSNRRSM